MRGIFKNDNMGDKEGKRELNISEKLAIILQINRNFSLQINGMAYH